MSSLEVARGLHQADRIRTNAMLPKFFASWLVVLVILPFTAPFSTCDVAILFGKAEQRSSAATPTPQVVTTDAAVPGGVVVSFVRRIRLLSHSRIPLAASATLPSSVSVTRSAASADCIREYVALSTILRL